MKPGKIFKPLCMTVAALVIWAFLAACGSKISQSSFEKIQTGMTQEEVIKILGEPTESSSIGMGPLSGTAAKWAAPEAVISIQFFNGKVKLKQFAKGEAN